MKNSLIRAGVPAGKVFCDYAGFRTLDSIVRARQVFGQRDIAFEAPEVDAYSRFPTRCREQLSKVNAVLDIFVFRRQPKYLGRSVAIGPA